MKDGMLPRKVVMRMIGRGVWLELLRRQDLYVCGLLFFLFILGVVVMRVVGIENPATGTFILNMGMTLAATCAHVLLLFLAVRQFPMELENRTLYPLLSRPVRRADLVLAKWIAVSVGGCVVYAVLVGVAWLSVPKLESYDVVLLVQVLLFQFVSLFGLAGLVLSLSLLMPRSMAVLMGGGLYFAGATLRRVIGQGSGMRDLLATYIPDFGMLDLTTRYTDGMAALQGSAFVFLLGYGLALILIFAVLAIALFERRRL